jgi:small-conductance mechanosensitive channel
MFLLTTILKNQPEISTSLPRDEHFFAHILDGWRVELEHFVQYGLPELVFALVLSIVAARIVAFFVKRMRKRADALVANQQRASQLRTMSSILRATAYAVIGFYMLTQLLEVIGVSLGPFIASAGVIGLGISFGAQSIFKDMLTGIFILIEDQYNVGDTVKIAGLSGTVEDISLRVTKLRDGDGTLYVVPNSQITTVSNLSRDFAVGTLNISVDAREDPDRVMAVLKQVAADVRVDESFKDIVIDEPQILGVDKISGYEVLYPINMRVKVNQRDGVLRALRRRVLIAFSKENIHFGSSSSTLVLQGGSVADSNATNTPPPVPSKPS